ncbi:MAG: sulfite exporter TauE/SafE family protein [Actinobacteria bacterium]|nr:sulfite exporter TauE/SafE family protein [Actinomycetota bacterium]
MSDLVWILVTVLIASSAQAVSGFGFALLAVPLMSAVVSPQDAVIIATLLGAASTIGQSVRDAHATEMVMARRLIGSALVGMPFGLVLFSFASEEVLRLSLGLVVIVATVLIARDFRLDGGRSAEYSMGFLSGALSTSLSTNGPPLVFLLQARGLQPQALRSTINTVFAVSGVASVLAFLVSGNISGDNAMAAMWSLPVMFIAILIGYRVRPLFPPHRFKWLVIVLLLLSGCSSLYGALK